MERRDGFGKYGRDGAYHWRWANPGSADYEPAAEARYDLLVDRVGRGGRLLDVGCGDGYLLSRVAGAHDFTAGLDPERGAIEIARRRLGGAAARGLARAAAGSLPYADRSFDTVVLAEVVEHLRRPARAVTEAARVLRDDGRLVLSTPQWRADGMWDEAHHHREYRPGELRRLLEAGFREVSITHFLSRRWWTARKLLGKGFVRAFSRLLYNPFAREGADPERFWHMLAVARGPRRPAET